MTWFNKGEEIRKLRAELDYLRSRVDKIEVATAYYETPNPLQRLACDYGYPMQTIEISKVVYAIVRHLGLEVRREPEKPATVTVTKAEKDGQAVRP